MRSVGVFAGVAGLLGSLLMSAPAGASPAGAAAAAGSEPSGAREGASRARVVWMAQRVRVTTVSATRVRIVLRGGRALVRTGEAQQGARATRKRAMASLGLAGKGQRAAVRLPARVMIDGGEPAAMSVRRGWVQRDRVVFVASLPARSPRPAAVGNGVVDIGVVSLGGLPLSASPDQQYPITARLSGPWANVEAWNRNRLQVEVVFSSNSSATLSLKAGENWLQRIEIHRDAILGRRCDVPILSLSGWVATRGVGGSFQFRYPTANYWLSFENLDVRVHALPWICSVSEQEVWIYADIQGFMKRGPEPASIDDYGADASVRVFLP